MSKTNKPFLVALAIGDGGSRIRAGAHLVNTHPLAKRWCTQIRDGRKRTVPATTTLPKAWL
jgi:hypothetical protein